MNIPYDTFDRCRHFDAAFNSFVSGLRIAFVSFADKIANHLKRNHQWMSYDINTLLFILLNFTCWFSLKFHNLISTIISLVCSNHIYLISLQLRTIVWHLIVKQFPLFFPYTKVWKMFSQFFFLPNSFLDHFFAIFSRKKNFYFSIDIALYWIKRI